MKPETILNAMLCARDGVKEFSPSDRRLRQAVAFRSRILKLFAEQDEDIEKWIDDYAKLFGELVELEAEYAHYQDQFHE